MTLVASDYKDLPTITEPPYSVVRRFTPTECARLQGFPDWWCAELGTDEPTTEEIAKWRKIFDTYDTAVNGKPKKRSDAKIAAWLKNPRSDAAEYKMWGNGVALPCVNFVLEGIAWAASLDEEER